jgi:uncharacterized protein
MELDLRGVVLFLTHACNLHCDYCFDLTQRHRGQLQPNVAGAALDWLFANTRGNRADISLFGGEPLLRPDFLEWLLPEARTRANAAGKKLSFSMTTNGTNMTPRIAAMLNEFKVSLTLSGDGAEKGQDAHRRFNTGAGSFAVVDEKIPLILEACPTTSVRMTVTPKNVAYLAEGVSYYLDSGFSRVSPTPVYEDPWTDESLDTYLEQLEGVGALFAREVVRGNTNFDLGGFSEHVRGLIFGGSRGRACGAAKTMVAVDTDGTIYPCHRFIGYTNRSKSYRLGDVFNGLDQIDDPLEGNMISDMKVSSETKGGCSSCSGDTKLHSGCAAVNVATTGLPLLAPNTYGRLEEIRATVVRTVVDYLAENHTQAFKAYLEPLSPGKKQESHDKLCIERSDEPPALMPHVSSGATIGQA